MNLSRRRERNSARRRVRRPLRPQWPWGLFRLECNFEVDSCCCETQRPAAVCRLWTINSRVVIDGDAVKVQEVEGVLVMISVAPESEHGRQTHEEAAREEAAR